MQSERRRTIEKGNPKKALKLPENFYFSLRIVPKKSLNLLMKILHKPCVEEQSIAVSSRTSLSSFQNLLALRSLCTSRK